MKRFGSSAEGFGPQVDEGRHYGVQARHKIPRPSGAIVRLWTAAPPFHKGALREDYNL
jgi:hypothetical protein